MFSISRAMVHQVTQDDDEVPQDINAFFVHPLNSGLCEDGGATALLHEYKSLPAIDKTCEESLSNDAEWYGIYLYFYNSSLLVDINISVTSSFFLFTIFLC